MSFSLNNMLYLELGSSSIVGPVSFQASGGTPLTVPSRPGAHGVWLPRSAVLDVIRAGQILLLSTSSVLLAGL